MRLFTLTAGVGLLIFVLMPLCALASPVERPAPAHLSSAYDRFKDLRTVSTSAENSALLSETHVLLMAQFACEGDSIVRPDTVRLVFLSNAEALSSADHLAFLVDGTRIPVPSLKHERDIGGGSGNAIRSVSAYLSSADFVRMAMAKQVEGQLGSLEFVIPSDLFESLQAMASLIQNLPRRSQVGRSVARKQNPPRGTPR